MSEQKTKNFRHFLEQHGRLCCQPFAENVGEKHDCLADRNIEAAAFPADEEAGSAQIRGK